VPKAVDRGALNCYRLGRALMGQREVTKPHQGENEKEHKQEQAHMQRHKDPPCVKFKG
jgi:hypothetical protein